MSLSYCVLPNRGVLKITGEDRVSFLQGLVSNDVTKATDTTGVYSAFLTPQGKFICDFFILAAPGAFLIDIEEASLAAFKKKLTMFKLRSDVQVADVSADYDILAIMGVGVKTGQGTYQDPRLPDAGFRAFVSKGHKPEDMEEVPFETYDLHRIKLGLPDGTRDITPEKSILLENGFDELNGVDWNKGCYMGQELTARTKYRALIKKRLFPVKIDGELPKAGTEVKADDKVVGEIHSGVSGYVLATIKLDALESTLRAGETDLKIIKPDWMIIQEAKG